MKKLAWLLAFSALWMIPAQSADDVMEAEPSAIMVPRELGPELSLFQVGRESAVEHSLAALRRYHDLLKRSPAVWMVAEAPQSAAGQKPPAEFAVTLERKTPLSDSPSRTVTRAMSLPIHGRNVYCVSAISDEMADKIEDVWGQMLRDVRTVQADHKLGFVYGDLDFTKSYDVIYHFADSDGNAGRADRPAVDTKPGMLAAIGTAMRDYCMAEDGAKLKTLEERTASLAAVIKQEKSADDLREEFYLLATRLDRAVEHIESERKMATSKKDLDDLAAETARDLSRTAQEAKALSKRAE